MTGISLRDMRVDEGKDESGRIHDQMNLSLFHPCRCD